MQIIVTIIFPTRYIYLCFTVFTVSNIYSNIRGYISLCHYSTHVPTCACKYAYIYIYIFVCVSPAFISKMLISQALSRSKSLQSSQWTLFIYPWPFKMRTEIKRVHYNHWIELQYMYNGCKPNKTWFEIRTRGVRSLCFFALPTPPPPPPAPP